MAESWRMGIGIHQPGLITRESDSIEADFRRMRAEGFAPMGAPLEDETGAGPLGAFACIAGGMVLGCLLTLAAVWWLT